MQPTLWGGALWQALFACCTHADEADFPKLYDLVFRLTPLLLPCEKCRAHFLSKRATVTRRAGGDPVCGEDVFRWLYILKDEVNKSKRVRSIEFEHFRRKHELHGGIVDDVALGDALVLVSLDARKRELDDLFVELCHALAALLPLPPTRSCAWRWPPCTGPCRAR